MRVFSVLLIPCILAACGVETASTAATAATVKKQELEQGRAAMGKVQRELDAAASQAAQRTAQAEEAK